MSAPSFFRSFRLQVSCIMMMREHVLVFSLSCSRRVRGCFPCSPISMSLSMFEGGVQRKMQWISYIMLNEFARVLSSFLCLTLDASEAAFLHTATHWKMLHWRACVCVCVCMCVWERETGKRERESVCVCVHIPIYIYMHICICICMYAHTYIHIFKSINTYICIHI